MTIDTVVGVAAGAGTISTIGAEITREVGETVGKGDTVIARLTTKAGVGVGIGEIVGRG